ncbi:MAG TPA: cupin domain-containing protein [Xanthobacteraceae bacterium]|nr:cupin domain-containing protein [Xanthobacteraceae bacterium]
MATAMSSAAAITYNFADDGRIPNNPVLPLVLYRSGIDLAGSPDPEAVIEKTFAANGWGNMWRNGIYPYAHYHSMIHEAMAIARGRAKVRFGGEDGAEIEIAPGDVVILPAGTGHQCLRHSRDLVVVGAYPPSGKYNLCRGTKAEHAKAVAAIRKVPLPMTDPAFGPQGPLLALWRA